MERGQSTVEVVIVFPVIVVMLWWALVPPLVGVRALAARAAAADGVRRAAVEDRPRAADLSQTVSEEWSRLSGAGDGRRVRAQVESVSVAVETEEPALEGAGLVRCLLRRWKESD